jgi:hypothetical protein
MTRMSHRQRARTAYGELDEIVVQLFDDLATEDELPRNAVSAATRAASSQRSSRPPNLRPMPPSAVDSGLKGDSGERLTNNKVSENQPNGPTPHGGGSEEFDIERRFAEESRLGEGAESLTSEEEKFIQDVVAWLEPRLNADLLLDRIEEDLWQNAIAASREDAVKKERREYPSTQPTTEDEKPTQGGQ